MSEAHSGNLTWTDIPHHFKTNVARELDPKSKVEYSLCSQLDKLAVSKASLHLKLLKIRQMKKLRQPRFYIEKQVEYEGKILTSKEGGLKDDDVFDRLVAIFRHKDTVVDELILGERRIDKYQGLLIKMLENILEIAKESKCRVLKVKKLRVLFYTPNLFEFLHFFDPKILTFANCENEGYPFCYKVLPPIVPQIEFPNFENVDNLRIMPTITTNLKPFYGPRMLSLKVDYIEMVDLIKFIKNFQRKPEGFFQIFTGCVRDKKVRNRILAHFTDLVVFDPLESMKNTPEIYDDFRIDECDDVMALFPETVDGRQFALYFMQSMISGGFKVNEEESNEVFGFRLSFGGFVEPIEKNCWDL
ncbi:hypothetical protein B9Z55_011217 [Caenorhabditis nigoni]|uniref:DUF38 domain-containing protein n=1 Tax=Caenorhabditis nigoni TaxID=1611254 RepID=A0A2G5UJ30_9PELO|nr:hypothetical protein B9Z55_011217 [Caenorhabditis nigoni]